MKVVSTVNIETKDMHELAFMVPNNYSYHCNEVIKWNLRETLHYSHHPAEEEEEGEELPMATVTAYNVWFDAFRNGNNSEHKVCKYILKLYCF
jgi:hypothetical protein